MHNKYVQIKINNIIQIFQYPIKIKHRYLSYVILINNTQVIYTGLFN